MDEPMARARRAALALALADRHGRARGDAPRRLAALADEPPSAPRSMATPFRPAARARWCRGGRADRARRSAAL
ncbi:MAG: hypothetical protein KF729_35290 [Sandaracinaceae bacterium]|nr:hypothetical protein [Sandaracinaceae bacterium]